MQVNETIANTGLWLQVVPATLCYCFKIDSDMNFIVFIVASIAIICDSVHRLRALEGVFCRAGYNFAQGVVRRGGCDVDDGSGGVVWWLCVSVMIMM